MSLQKSVTGTCLCKAVSFKFSPEKEIFDACHCSMCRKWGGGPIMTVNAGTAVQFTGQESIAMYSSSAWAQRGFCKGCGTHLFYLLKHKGEYHMPLGVIDQNKDFKFELQIFVDHKPDNYAFENKTIMMTQEEVFNKSKEK